MQDYLVLKFTLKREYDELIQENIFNFDNIGFEIDDPIEKEKLLSELPEWEISDIDISDNGYINYGVYFEDSSQGNSELDRLIKFLKNNISDFNYEKNHIDNSNWEEEWKKSYKSFNIGNNILIKPSWEEVPSTDRIIIEIDPKMAFGTGTHETTSMCMEYVEDMDMSGKSVLDIGCGSGILSILTKKLNAKKVIACDIDTIAIESTLDNAKINGVEIEAFESDLFSKVDGKFDIIFANILAEIIVKMLVDVNDYLKDDGLLILSGIINEKEELIEKSLEHNGLEIVEIKRKNEWSLISARRKNA